MRTLAFSPALGALLLVSACAESPPETKTAPATAPPAPAASPDDEVKQARAVFLANIKAIQDRNKEAYVASYRADDRLVRAGADGLKLGYADFAKGAPATGSDDWPEKLEADDVQTHWLAPGVVYGAYRYRVTIKGVTTTGISERVLLKLDDGWKISVTTAFEAPEPKADAGAKD
jgi:hypothetical protein